MAMDRAAPQQQLRCGGEMISDENSLQ